MAHTARRARIVRVAIAPPPYPRYPSPQFAYPGPQAGYVPRYPPNPYAYWYGYRYPYYPYYVVPWPPWPPGY